MLELDSYIIRGADGYGNQKKIWIDNKLYKVDSKFRDSTKEVSASSIAEAFGIYHVTYERTQCTVDDELKWCCCCASYLRSKNDTVISFNQLLEYYGICSIDRNMSSVDYFELMCKCIVDYTKLDYNYVRFRILQILTFDFLIVNDDRHLRNFEVIRYENGKFDIAPMFDNGHSFFRKDSMLTNSEIETLSRKFKPKPFSSNQWKNLIDLNFAKQQTSAWLTTAKQKYGGLANIPNVLDSHKKILRLRSEMLLNKN